MNRFHGFRNSLAAGIALLAMVWSGTALSQNTVSEDFTGSGTNNNWYYFSGACLTAGTSTGGTNPGQIPSCLSIASSYYFQQHVSYEPGDAALVGGKNGVYGNATTLPDPVGSGALRFTNGNCSPSACGYGEHGAIVSANPFDAGQGVQITFKTVTYRGDSGGTGQDGADGMSFYLLDGSVSPTNGLWNGIGSWGGSLGYSCSNTNPPYDGLIGAYLGLGIDEFGNFLNQGDNTAAGYGYVPGRIGLRGNGNVSWAYLNATYPSNYPSTLTAAQQQAAVQATCSTG